jgi:hypothetical protein
VETAEAILEHHSSDVEIVKVVEIRERVSPHSFVSFYLC